MLTLAIVLLANFHNPGPPPQALAIPRAITVTIPPDEHSDTYYEVIDILTDIFQLTEDFHQSLMNEDFGDPLTQADAALAYTPLIFSYIKMDIIPGLLILPPLLLFVVLVLLVKLFLSAALYIRNILPRPGGM